MSILQDIYDGQYSPTDRAEDIPQELREKTLAFYGEIERVLGSQFIEKHWDTLCELESLRDINNFREGFRLGVALMLEACGPSA